MPRRTSCLLATTAGVQRMLAPPRQQFQGRLWGDFMADRYFSAQPIGDATHALLTDDEAHHLSQVMRAQVGDEVLLFDGEGDEFHCQIRAITRRQVDLTVCQRVPAHREASVALTLAVALPKGDRQRWLIEKAVELGVATLVPLVTERGVAEPIDRALSRLRRAVIEASKQCGRNRLMEIAPAAAWPRWVASCPISPRWLAHPGGEGDAADTLRRDAALAGAACVAIGPEGGFTPSEIELARVAGWRTMTLGPRVLRVETAAIAAAAVLLLP